MQPPSLPMPIIPDTMESSIAVRREGLFVTEYFSGPELTARN